MRTAYFLWQRAERGSKFSYDSYKRTNPLHEGSTLMTPSNPNYLPNASPPNSITLGWGVVFQSITYSLQLLLFIACPECARKHAKYLNLTTLETYFYFHCINSQASTEG